MKTILCKKQKVRKRSEQGRSYIHIPIALWIIVGCSFAFVLCMHMYNDILITAKQGYSFWDLLFEGRALEFYSEARMTTGSEYFPREQGAAYLLPLYLLFAIWNFPTWIISNLVGTDLFNTIPSMIWIKLMLVPFVIISAKYVFRIICRIPEKKEFAIVGAFFFVSSVIVMSSTALIGQYDIITTMFILIGLDAWADKDNKKYILFFGIAVLFKYFAFLIFLPLLLLEEKKIRKIIIKLLLVCLPIIPFLLFPRPKNQGSNVSSLINKMFCEIQVGQNTLFLFPLIVAVVLAFCYFRSITDDNKLRYGVYYSFIIMGCFCVLLNPFPYWNVLAVPSFVLLIFLSNNMHKTMILEIVICLLITIRDYIMYYWCYGISTIGAMGLMHRVLGKEAPEAGYTFSLLYKFAKNPTINSIVFTLLVFVFILMIYYSRPNAKKELRFEPFQQKTLYIRTIINVLLVLSQSAFIAAYMLFKDIIL